MRGTLHSRTELEDDQGQLEATVPEKSQRAFARSRQRLVYGGFHGCGHVTKLLELGRVYACAQPVPSILRRKS